MSDTNVFKIENDYRLEAYETIFNHAWAKQISQLTDSTALDDPAFALSVNWRAAANTHTFPWMMTAALSGFWQGATSQHWSTKLVNAIAQEIPNRMEGKISRMKQRELAQEIRSLAQRLKEGLLRDDDATLTKEKIWQWFQDQKLYEFHAAVWGSQRLCFSSLFHSYENYIREVLAIAEGSPEYRTGRFDDLKADVEKHFGKQVVEDCLEGEFLKITRLVRNALAHNGGRETPKLKAMNHGISVEGGVLQIQAPDNRRLIGALERRTIILTEAAIKLPQFQLPATEDVSADG